MLCCIVIKCRRVAASPQGGIIGVAMAPIKPICSPLRGMIDNIIPAAAGQLAIHKRMGDLYSRLQKLLFVRGFPGFEKSKASAGRAWRLDPILCTCDMPFAPLIAQIGQIYAPVATAIRNFCR